MSGHRHQHSDLRKRVLQSLKQTRINMPTAPDPVSEENQFPLDITALSDVAVRRLMSFWTAHLGYLNSYHSRCMVDAMAFKREVKQYERMFKAKHKGEKDKVWEIDAELANDNVYQRYVNRWEEAEAMAIVTKSLKESYESYYASASRELTARMGEYSRDMSHRSGT